MIYGNGIPTPTVVYRKDLYLEYMKDVQPEKRGWMMGDLPMWLWFAANTRIAFIDEVTTTYRILENSASHSNDIKKNEDFFSSSRDIRHFFISKYPQYKYMSIDVDDGYWRTMLSFGEKYNLLEYSLNCLNHIIKKTFKEKIKYILYHTKFGFSIQTLFRKHRDE